jgi:hypothetical protein
MDIKTFGFLNRESMNQNQGFGCFSTGLMVADGTAAPESLTNRDGFDGKSQ